MSSITVVCPNARRCAVKVTPGTLLKQVVEEACLKQGFEMNKVEAKNHGRLVDLSLPFRLSGLPNNATIELSTSEGVVGSASTDIALQLPDGTRKQLSFSVATSLEDVLGEFSKQMNQELLSTEDGFPSLMYMNKQYTGDELKLTALSSIGTIGGKHLIRFSRRQLTEEEKAAMETRLAENARKLNELSTQFEKMKNENEERERLEQKFEEDIRLRKEQEPEPMVEDNAMDTSESAAQGQMTDANPLFADRMPTPPPVASSSGWSFESSNFSLVPIPQHNTLPPSSRLEALTRMLNETESSSSNIAEILANHGRAVARLLRFFRPDPIMLILLLMWCVSTVVSENQDYLEVFGSGEYESPSKTTDCKLPDFRDIGFLLHQFSIEYGKRNSRDRIDMDDWMMTTLSNFTRHYEVQKSGYTSWHGISKFHSMEWKSTELYNFLELAYLLPLLNFATFLLSEFLNRCGCERTLWTLASTSWCAQFIGYIFAALAIFCPFNEISGTFANISNVANTQTLFVLWWIAFHQIPNDDDEKSSRVAPYWLAAASGLVSVTAYFGQLRTFGSFSCLFNAKSTAFSLAQLARDLKRKSPDTCDRSAVYFPNEKQEEEPTVVDSSNDDLERGNDDLKARQNALREEVCKPEYILPKEYIDRKNRDLKLAAYQHTVLRFTTGSVIVQANFLSAEPSSRLFELISSILPGVTKPVLLFTNGEEVEISSKKNLIETNCSPKTTIIKQISQNGPESVKQKQIIGALNVNTEFKKYTGVEVTVESRVRPGTYYQLSATSPVPGPSGQ